MSKLQQGAKQAIENCLRVINEDRVVIITDNITQEIGQALYAQAQLKTENLKLVMIEDFVSRPAKDLPQSLTDTIEQFAPTVSIYAASGQTGELPVFRRPLINLLTYKLKCRHAHMIGITEKLMEIGMTCDYGKVADITHKLHALLLKTTQIHVTDKHGTDITYALNPNWKWVAEDGVVKPGQMANLPSGECFTCPSDVNGTFVGWICGDYLSEKYGALTKPIKFSVVSGKLVSIDSELTDVKSDFEAYVKQYEHGNRVGELGIGTLVGLTEFVGNLLQDEKFPGVHMAFGGSYADETGADWNCPSYIDSVARDVNIDLYISDKWERVMTEGKYAL